MALMTDSLFHVFRVASPLSLNLITLITLALIFVFVFVSEGGRAGATPAAPIRRGQTQRDLGRTTVRSDAPGAGERQKQGKC